MGIGRTRIHRWQRISVALMALTAAAGSPRRPMPTSCNASPGNGWLDGRVLDDQGRTVSSALVSVSWHATAVDTPIDANDGRFTISDDQGRWTLCDVPLSTLVVRAAKGGQSDAAVAVLDSTHQSDWVSLELARRTNTNAAEPAVVAIILVDQSGIAVDATIELKTSGGVKRLKTTNGNAFTTLPGAQRIEISARAIGYKPGSVVASVDRGTNTIPLIMNPASVPTLAPMRVVGNREVLARHDAFEERRRLGLATASITAEEIEKRNPVSAWQMLANVPSLRILPFGNGVYVKSNRGDRMVNLQLRPCWMRVMIDGIALPDSMPDLERLPAPAEIHGMEVFAGPASIPPQYNSALGGGGGSLGNNMCGLIAIWTK